MLLSLVIAFSCVAPGARDSGGPTGTAETRRTLLAARLVDVRDGGSFALKDFGGKVVIVLGIAVW